MSRGGRGKRTWGDNGWDELGGYMNVKKKKLADQFNAGTADVAGESTPGKHIFEGVSIHVNGYTAPSSDELKRLMKSHGGMYHQYYSKTKVTHIIATRLPYAKIKELREEKIVKPEWIIDSITARKLLPDAPYQLYTSRINAQGTLKFASLPQKDSGSRCEERTSGQNETLDGHGDVHQESASVSEAGVHSGNSESPPHGPASTTETDDSRRRSFDGSSANQVAAAAAAALGSTRGKTHGRAGDPNFMSEFYSNSRLHHISTWGAELKEFVARLQSGDATFPGRRKLGGIGGFDTANVAPRIPDASTNQWEGIRGKPAGSERVIMHVDMDCFFVSVGLRKRPDLRGKPVAVTHSKGEKGASEVNVQTREYEKAYYASKYEQGGNAGVGSRSHRSEDKTPASPQPVEGRPSTLQTEDVEPSNSSLPFDEEMPVCVQTTEDKTPCRPIEDGSLSAPQIDKAPLVHEASPVAPGDVPHQQQGEQFNSMAEIASCSYEARRFGVKNGMFMGTALRLCPELQTIPYDFDGYREVSQILYETVASYTHDIEAVSCDEMFVDITGVLKDTGISPVQFAQVLRNEIKEKTDCNASAGLACNILLARMSTRIAKPCGQYWLEHSEEAVEFMKKHPVRDLPGVGRSTACRLQAMGVQTCSDLQSLSLGALQKEFGPKTGQSLYSYCRGIDDRPIRVERERKSVSAEINYGIRFTKIAEADNFVSELAEEVHRRLTAAGMLGRTVTLKLKVRRAGAPRESAKFMGHGICDNLARSCTLAQATASLEPIRRESQALLRLMCKDASDLKGMGIQISRLSRPGLSSGTSSSSNKSLLDFVKPLASTAAQPSTAATQPSTAAAQPFTTAAQPFTTAAQPSTTVPQPSTTVPQPSTTVPQPFTTAVQPHTTVTQPPTMVQPTKKTVGSILNFMSKQKAGSSSSHCLSHSPKKIPLPPLPSLGYEKAASSTFLPPPRPSGSRTSSLGDEEEEELCLPSPSQLDPSVLAALPRGIRENIQRTYRIQLEKKRRESALPSVKTSPALDIRSETILPAPAPTESDCLQSAPKPFRLVSPFKPPDLPASSSASLEQKRKIAESSKSPQGGQSSAPIGPDPPGYDPNVLNELPPEIIREILSEERVLKNRSRETEGKNRWGDALGPVEALPSPSQIDPSCMDALPSDLKTELRLAYQRQQRAARGNVASPPRPAGARPSKSSPFKLHRRRGKSRKQASPRKAAPQGWRAPDVKELVTGVKRSPVKGTTNDGDPIIAVPCDSAATGENVKPVSLCGAVRLRDVKALLREWTTSVEEPGDEDIEHLSLYLNDLILDRNLEMTDLVLRAMKRLTNQMESVSPWRDAYQILVDRVQGIIAQIYHSRLKTT